jgi:hypothetical protein
VSQLSYIPSIMVRQAEHQEQQQKLEAQKTALDALL